MRRLLKLHHHKHTGKLIHHRHTSYRALFLLVLMTGACLFFTARMAHAADLLVSATVPAPVPPGAPAFTAPPDGTVTDDPHVVFQGTCPVITPAVIIALYENNNLLGSGPCEADGTFVVAVQLAPGSHTIVATVVTITNETGESSAPHHITYTPKTPPATPSTPRSTPSTPPSPSTAPLDITTDQAFLTYGNNTPAQWKGHFSGGTPPYKITISWGDGGKTVEDNAVPGTKTYAHPYKDRHQYIVTITVSDSRGLSLSRYFVAISLAPQLQTHTAGLFGNINDFPEAWMMYSLLLYILLLILLILMWWYEHTHHRQTVGVPMHYGWQLNRSTRQRPH